MSNTTTLSLIDALAIQNILAAVPNAALLPPADGNDAEALQMAQQKVLTKSQLCLQDALRASKKSLQARHTNIQGSSESSLHSDEEKDVVTTKMAKATHSFSSNSINSLAPLKEQQLDLFNNATSRLLRAETELALLKLIMAQSQREISGLEEEIFRKQAELAHHRTVFDYILELERLGFEIQIHEGQIQIKELESLVQKTVQGKEEAVAEAVKALEGEIRSLQQQLTEKREAFEKVQEPQMTDRQQDLETIIIQLRDELVLQTRRAREAEAVSKGDQEELERTRVKLQRALLDGDGDAEGVMVEHLEKEYKKKTVALRTSLAQVYRVNRRLGREMSALARKVVRVESINEELVEQAKQDRAEIKSLKCQAEFLQEQLITASGKPSDDVGTASAADECLVASLQEQITALDIQIDGLSSSLRLKEQELEEAHGEAEQLLLKLESELAQQKEAHAKEMKEFAEEKKLQAQRERACQNASVTLFQNMVTKLQTELSETQEKLRDTTICWGNTKEQLQKCEQAYRRRKRDLEVTTKHLHEVEETVLKLGDAITMLEMEKETNMVLVRSLEERDRELRDMEYRLRVLEEEHE
ncbi:hypothetical protein BCR41DRAFT_385290 [Lobosporangium transversale]|uniref:Up-regulated during septation-domain-containing protein n=1 Tax=Lobosporangium transversale TaxID=64571 RepID=A0A1Y2GU45_9FUNG|nr:hypothetical protein BCR41DRAFT_385290 [Lobosporangium transversale]ORZ21869.1 hypothetical protein BCR41DRAFT_385290 [Lobosporangium transversale]|eukprot:XP_021883120.1 hypothetical protein BCR41DRAFT_385290 [Lobosporangium transversale]